MGKRKLPRVGGSLFYEEPMYEYLGEIVTFKNPEAAKGAVEELKRLFKEAKTREKKMRIWRATDLAWKRAEATLKRRNLSVKERREYREIAKIYKKAAKWMHERL